MMNNSIKRFQNVLGVKSLIAGVYTTDDNPQRIANELRFLNSLGVGCAYIEDDTSLENPDRKPQNIQTIRSALELLANDTLNIKIGVNIMPNRQGTEHEIAFDLAKTYSLSFIVVDLVYGTHKIKRKTLDAAGNDYDLVKINAESYAQKRSENSELIVIGGFSSPYAESVFDSDSLDPLTETGRRTDAILYKALPVENKIPREGLRVYKTLSELPIVGASKITPSNIIEIADVADAFIVGSKLRDEHGKLSFSNINAIEKVLSPYRH